MRKWMTRVISTDDVGRDVAPRARIGEVVGILDPMEVGVEAVSGLDLFRQDPVVALTFASHRCVATD